MSSSKAAPGRRMAFDFLAVAVAVVTVSLVPHHHLVTSWGGWCYFPAWVALGHLTSAASHVVVTGSLRRSYFMLKGTLVAYRSRASFAHLRAAVGVAAVEEVLFRYAALPWVTDRLGAMVGLVVVSALFSAAHLGLRHRPRPWRHFLDLFLFGLLLGAAVLWTRSLYPALLLHATRNYLLRCILVSRAEYQRVRAEQ